jgi:Holliday junction resolvase-like predicted endonuclease
MQDGEVIVVVEVKAQTSAKLLDPIYQITPTKQKKLRLLGSLISIRYPKSMIRIDAVTLVIGPGQEPFITHYQNIL